MVCKCDSCELGIHDCSRFYILYSRIVSRKGIHIDGNVFKHAKKKGNEKEKYIYT